MRACRRHPREPAGWACASCHAELCADCVAKQMLGAKSRPVTVCSTCGRAVPPLTMHRREAEPFQRRMWQSFGYTLGATGIISLLFVGFIRALCSYMAGKLSVMGGMAYVLREGTYWAFFFFIIRGVGKGERRMGVFDLSDFHSDIVAPAVKGLIATTILWLPVALYIYMAADNGIFGILTYPVYQDPAVWLMALIGALYAPMALLAAATDLGFAHILNPIFICTLIYRTGRDYFVAVLTIAVVLLLGMAATALVDAMLKSLTIPFIGRWIPSTLGLYAPYVAAAILGHLLYLHGEVLDWGRSEEYQVLLLPGVEPRGQYSAKPKEPPPPRPQWVSMREPDLDENPAAPPSRLAEPLPPPPPESSQLNLELTSGLASLLNLSASLDASTAPDDPPPPTPGISSELKVELDAGIVVPADPPPGARAQRPAAAARPAIPPRGPVLEAQAFYSESGPVDLPPAIPSLPMITAPVSATVLAQNAPTPPPPGTAAPTVFGFSPALPSAENQATRIGHQAVQPPPPSLPAKKA